MLNKLVESFIMAKKAVILLSGGLDSATIAAMAKADGYKLYALSFRYGQRHAVELAAAAKIAADVGVQEHKIVDIDLRLFAGSALTSDLEVPKNRIPDETATHIPVTYVPARNTIFLSFALAYAETLKTGDIFIGVNAVDYSGYPDCRPEFIKSFEQMANLATAHTTEGKYHITIHSPLIEMSKADIIRMGNELGVNYALTVSCYDPDVNGRACGCCDSCLLRARGFKGAKIADPTLYIDKFER